MKWIILLSGIALSCMAGYLSILGMQAIFPGDPLLIGLIIGTIEFSKYATAIWVHSNWDWINFKHKFLSTSLMIILALLTSMSIFGFFSKQHLESSRSTGDVQAKIQIIESKIDFENQNIEDSKKGLTQLNTVVDEIVSRSDKERSILTANRIRNTQKKERAELLSAIELATSNIQKLNEEKFPLQAEMRNATIEVGAVRYIAELIYGESSTEILEKAVRFVIIALVFVFDPFAIYLLVIFDMRRPEPIPDKTPNVIPEPNTVPEKVDILSNFEKNTKKKESFQEESRPLPKMNTSTVPGKSSPFEDQSDKVKAPDVVVRTKDFPEDEIQVSSTHDGIRKIKSDGLTMFEKSK